MNRNDCDIARDLMPLSVDGVCSEGSQRFLDEHTALCAPCKALYARMKAEPPVPRAEPAKESQALKKGLRWLGRRFKALWITLIALACVVVLVLTAAGINQIYLHQTADVPLELYGPYLSSSSAVVSLSASCQFNAMAYIDHHVEQKIIGATQENLTGQPEAVILTYTLEYYPNQNKNLGLASNFSLTMSEYELCRDGSELYLIGGWDSTTASDGEHLLLVKTGLPVSEIRFQAGDTVKTIYTWGSDFEILPDKLDDYFYPASRIMLQSDYEEMTNER